MVFFVEIVGISRLSAGAGPEQRPGTRSPTPIPGLIFPLSGATGAGPIQLLTQIPPPCLLGEKGRVKREEWREKSEEGSRERGSESGASGIGEQMLTTVTGSGASGGKS